ncbi:peroxiredoxin [Vannielia litorea]|uniref:thioredoxin-dependent peroxiredoxin n=1 Tax=Vannielia litorea TaxID=1217970 RepID=A0A1N6EQU9_9RHOB|nr:peroxiredoxin [Vannielia litorea]SIN85469.1 peroxiredoxin Q/BCP [Vannielia litorea]
MDLTGTPAPDFTLPRDGGGELSLSGLRPAPVVLYFYPRDDTPGCTTEALDFTAALPQFETAGAKVVGVSRDTVAKHEKFIAKHGLGIPLVADEDGSVCEAYGTWVEKSMYGKKSMGIERATFLIDGAGTVVREWRKVKVKGHVDEVLEAVRDL